MSRKIKFSVILSLTVDSDEFMMPVDGQVSEDVLDEIQDAVESIDGVKINNIKKYTGANAYD